MVEAAVNSTLTLGSQMKLRVKDNLLPLFMIASGMLMSTFCAFLGYPTLSAFVFGTEIVGNVIGHESDVTK